MTIIDAKGWVCPKPLIETKKLLDTMPEGEVTTIVDNRIAVDNLSAFAKSVGFEVESEQKDNLYHVKITKTKNNCNCMPMDFENNIVVFITSNLFGTGDEELGASLMKAYIYALTEVPQKPKTIMFANSGVFLTTEGSEVLDSLEELEAQGVEILSCGACLNFYDLTESLKIGKISNMYNIASKLNEATNAIRI
jgi:selenium metabolism protein YedF